ncbi:MAG: Crp/Fnr family transcriptional regulator [Bacteroidaceae bacterium]|nr:Crp/Fnr family transcriptional regulator [Bacteroidaceae bacterium]
MPIYDQLLQLPLFQGHSREDLTAILAKIKVDFRTFRPKQEIVRQDDPCRHIIFLLEGEVQLTRCSFHKDLNFIEAFSAPYAFGTESLFGLRQSFSHTIQALTHVRVLIVSKQDIINHLFAYEVFHYNLLNQLSTRIQRTNHLLWAPHEGDTLQHFTTLLKRNFLYHGGHKQIAGGMVALARMLGDTRLHISHMLNNLQSQGLLTLSRKMIDIPHLEQLLQYEK